MFNVFQDGICHPKMALVIDDRLKVWDEKDQPRVHVVPAFAPYYAPQAEVCIICILICSYKLQYCNNAQMCVCCHTQHVRVHSKFYFIL